MHPKDAEGIANSVDPNQTAPQVSTFYPDLSVRKLRNMTVLCDLLYVWSNAKIWDLTVHLNKLKLLSINFDHNLVKMKIGTISLQCYLLTEY